MAYKLQVSIKDVGSHKNSLVPVIFLTGEVENPLNTVRAVSLWENCWILTESTARICLGLCEPRIQIWVKEVVKGVCLFLRSHSQVGRLGVLGKMLIDIADINAAIEKRVLILNVILVCRG